MLRFIFTIIAFIIITYTFSWPTIINIPADYPTIQQGIDASFDGDTVLVQPGTYIENLSIVDKNIVLASNFLFSLDTLDIVNTVIDGDSSYGTIITMHNCDNLSNICGLKFTDDNNSMDMGFYINQCDSVIIENNIFEYLNIDHVIETDFNHHIEILRNSFRFNVSIDIWGIILECDDYLNGTIIKNNIFHDNSNVMILIPDTHGLIFEENTVYNNEGIIVWSFNSGPTTVKNNIIYNNHYGIGYDGGGIFHAQDSEIIAEGNVIYNNTGSSSSYLGTFNIDHYPTPVIFTNNIIWGNSYINLNSVLFFESGVQPTITYTDIQGGWPGEGNIECDPQFCDPDSGNFYLHFNSCCVGAGQNGENMGVYGAGCWSACSTYVVGDVNGSGAFDGLDIVYGVAYLKGGPAPKYVCECTQDNILYAAGDVNGSCSYNGLDITYGVAYLKGGFYLIPCPDCPPVLD